MTATLNTETGEIVDDETTDDETPETPEPDDEPDDDDEQAEEEEEPHAGPVSDEQHAQVFDKAIKRAKTYMQAVPTILGDSAHELSLCPRCTDLLPGFILPPEIKPVVGDQLVAVKLSIGEGLPRQLKQDKRAFQCDECGGEGKVETGSHVRGQAELKCEGCNGRGWIGPRSATAPAPPEQPTGNGAVEFHDDGSEKPALDPWGRMRGEPLYGVMPGFES